MLFGILYIVFTNIIRFGNVPHYTVPPLSNIVLFSYFQEETGAASAPCWPGGDRPQDPVPPPRGPAPPAVIALFTPASTWSRWSSSCSSPGVDPMWTWLLFPLVLIRLRCSRLASRCCFGANVRFRDVGVIRVVVAQALFYGSPIIYPIDLEASGTLRPILLINPLTPILEQARHWVIDPTAPGAVSAAGSWLHMLPRSLLRRRHPAQDLGLPPPGAEIAELL